MLAAVRTSDGTITDKGALSALIIPLSADGVTRRRIHNSGVSASGSTFIELDDVRVPIENLLGGTQGLGKGFNMIVSSQSCLFLGTRKESCANWYLQRLQSRAVCHCGASLEDVPRLL